MSVRQGKRHQTILDMLRRDGVVDVEELAERFAVNAVTIRRDLAALEEDGVLRRTRGGAMVPHSGRVEFAFHSTDVSNAQAKAAIARAAAARVEPGMAICLDTGTTTLAVARELARVPGLRILTTSLAIAAELHACDHLELVLLGGTVRRDSTNLSGMLAEENLRRFRVHMAILGADALGPEGVYTTDTSVARLSEAMIESADHTLLVADSTKFSATAFVRYADWSRIGALVTDANVPDGVQAWLPKQVKEWVCVDVETAEPTEPAEASGG